MYQSLKEYPTDLQETLRNLLIQAITNYVRIIHIYILYASNDSELKNLDSLKTEVVKYSIKLIAEGSCLAEKISCSSVMSNTCSYKQLAHIQKLKILSDELSPDIVLGENLNKINCKKSGIIKNAVDKIKQFIVRRDDSGESNKTDTKINTVENWNTPLDIENYDTFKTNIELIIERLNNFQDTIRQSMIISQMIRNYSLYSSKTKYPKKLLKTGVILFIICGGINLLWKANWLLYATAIFVSMQIIYYHKSIINNIVQWNMLKHYENIAKRFDS